MLAELPLLFSAKTTDTTDGFLAAVAGPNESGRRADEKLLVVNLPSGGKGSLPSFTNEFWTAKQRAAHSLHEISYRACFKPQLPRYFIDRLTEPGALVYDPFMGRGTTLLEAALLDRRVAGCDLNPLSALLVRARLQPPTLDEISERLAEIPLTEHDEFPDDLLVFYHPDTLREICSLKRYFLQRQKHRRLDAIDDWIRLVAINRLTGHSPGFFSVYTMPPNQAVSVKSQARINARRKQTPPPREVRRLIFRKSKQLLADCTPEEHARLARLGPQAQLFTGPADRTSGLAANSVDLVVTSPPFLDIVDYKTDNWLRCWFAGIDSATVPFTVPRKLDEWRTYMTSVFRQLHRVLRSGGTVAFEVGEVRGGTVRLEESVIPAAMEAGLEPVLVMINCQQFTKTANCWGVDNNDKGTNSNRIVVLRKR